MSDAGAAPTASLIVPAFNEQDRIGPLLPVLAAATRELGCRVIVACNGCTDNTVAMARETDGVDVLVLDRPSKPHALNAAEAAAGELFPRLYVDADVRTDVTSIRLLLDALEVSEPCAVRPFEDYEWLGSAWLPRTFYRGRYEVPSSRAWLESHIEGHHIYGTNAAGRARFGPFPEEGQMMEDAYFDRMFDAHQKVAVAGATVTVPLPSSGRALLRGMTRIYQGNWELDEWLLTNRPDSVEPPPRVQRSKVASVWQSIRPGGDTFASWRPSTVATATVTVVLRTIAIRRARRHVRAGRQAAWR